MVSSANGPTVSTVPPATLPGTPSSPPFPEEELIRKARYFFEKTENGVKDESMLADDFRFEFPIISLDRKRYLDAVRSFGLKDAFPNLDAHPYHFRVDPYEPQRVWFTTRATGTHTGTLSFAALKIKPTHTEYRALPECNSVVFNAEGKVITFTGGYPMDRRVGNGKGYGGLFGILAAIGQPVPGSLRFFVKLTAVNAFNLAFRIANIFTLGVLGRLTKQD